MNDNQNAVEQYIPAGDGWDDAAAEAGERVIRGALLKFNDRRWTRGKEAVPIADGTRLVALATAAMWVRWEEGKPVEYRVRRPGERLPERKELGYDDEREWPNGPGGEPQDVWQNTRLIYLTDPDTAEAFTFSTSSGGGRSAVVELGDHCADAQRPPRRLAARGTSRGGYDDAVWPQVKAVVPSHWLEKRRPRGGKTRQPRQGFDHHHVRQDCATSASTDAAADRSLRRPGIQRRDQFLACGKALAFLAGQRLFFKDGESPAMNPMDAQEANSSHTHVWRSQEADWPCTPTGRDGLDPNGSGRIYWRSSAKPDPPTSRENKSSPWPTGRPNRPERR